MVQFYVIGFMACIVSPLIAVGAFRAADRRHRDGLSTGGSLLFVTLMSIISIIGWAIAVSLIEAIANGELKL